MQTTETDNPEKIRLRRHPCHINKWFYRENTRCMPRMRNLPPYDSNEIVQWFSKLYQCNLEQGRRHWENAKSLSCKSAKANPTKWPAFLLFDHETQEWHGADT